MSEEKVKIVHTCFVCSACGRFGYQEITFIDSGTTLTCDSCDGKTVIDLDTPEARADKYKPSIELIKNLNELKAGIMDALGNGADEELWPPGTHYLEALKDLGQKMYDRGFKNGMDSAIEHYT